MTTGLEWGTELRPRYVTALFRPLLSELTQVLRSLSPGDWKRPTVAGAWTIHDVVAHLVDTALRKIAATRDGHLRPPPFPIETNQDLTRFINQLNAGGVEFGARLSGRLLIDLLELTDSWLSDLHESLPPHGPATFAVSWAGETVSQNWMDIGREYTERWHHQMQIRDAMGMPRLLEPRFMDPLLDFSVRAFPFAYQAHTAPIGTTVTFAVRGATSGAWTVAREERSWRVLQGRPSHPTSALVLDADDAWRLLYNAVTPELMDRLSVEGDRTHLEPMLRTRSIIV